jgi:tetratricopeptide (TPR) repeat protein
MTSTGKLTTKAIAIVIILAILNAVGLSPVVLVFFTSVALIIWLVVRRAQMREVERIFEFYVAADAILREEERRWYGFEIAEVIEHGENVLELMPDPPPLSYYALGALYQRLGNHAAAVQYLSRLTDDEQYEETNRVAPSSQLRRYVMMLRRLEYHPATEPQTLGAIRSLERSRRNGGRMLLESRKEVETAAATATTTTAETPVAQPNPEPFPASAPLSSISAPPPISTVLRDVYQEETSANN